MADNSRRNFTEERAAVGVIGGGAWGTALAMHCARMGHSTLVWAREEEVVRDINNDDVRENTLYLKVRGLTWGCEYLHVCMCYAYSHSHPRLHAAGLVEHVPFEDCSGKVLDAGNQSARRTPGYWQYG